MYMMYLLYNSSSTRLSHACAPGSPSAIHVPCREVRSRCSVVVAAPAPLPLPLPVSHSVNAPFGTLPPVRPPCHHTRCCTSTHIDCCPATEEDPVRGRVKAATATTGDSGEAKRCEGVFCECAALLTAVYSRCLARWKSAG